MAVKSTDLRTPEDGLVLNDRAAAAAVEELKALRARLAAAKATTPQPGDFARGWASALRAIEG